jgi:hypothetical protein
VPDSKWYEARLAKRYDAEVERRRQALVNRLYPTLRADLQDRYRRLDAMRQAINSQPLEGQTWFLEVRRKLDYLLEKFLQFASKEAEFRTYLAQVLEEECGPGGRAVPSRQDVVAVRWVDDRRRGDRGRKVPVEGGDERQERPGPLPSGDERWVQSAIDRLQQHYHGEQEQVKAAMEQETDVNTKAVLEKRLDVLQRRHEFVGKMGKILANLNHQLHLLEDTFGLINDEIRARSPEQILADIEDVVFQTDTMTQVLEEVATYDQMVARLST